MLALILFATAFADTADIKGPARCEAVLNGPVDSCQLDGTWAATGTGPNARRASHNALSRLQHVVRAAVDVRMAQHDGSVGKVGALEARDTCPAVLRDEARVFCYAETDLAQFGTCFAHLPVRECWRGVPLMVEGPAWRAMEAGRDRLCDAVDQDLDARGASEAERLACQVRCLQEATISCPR